VCETLLALFSGGDFQSDVKTPYETLAQIMALFAKAGLSRIDFVSDPTPVPNLDHGVP